MSEFEKTVTLLKPIRWRGKEFTTITARPPRIGERRRAEMHYQDSSSPVADALFAADLLASACNLLDGAEFFDLMDCHQMEEQYAWVSSFLEGGDRCNLRLASNVLTLRRPIEAKGVAYTEFQLERPLFAYKRKALGYLRNAQRPFNKTQAACAMVSFCTGAPLEAVDQLDVDQFEACWEWIAPFFFGTPIIGNS